MRATEILFESRAAVLKAEAETKLVEKQIELELLRNVREQHERDTALLRQALEALENSRIEYDFHGNPYDEDNADVIKAIDALRQRLNISSTI